MMHVVVSLVIKEVLDQLLSFGLVVKFIIKFARFHPEQVTRLSICRGPNNLLELYLVVFKNLLRERFYLHLSEVIQRVK